MRSRKAAQIEISIDSPVTNIKLLREDPSKVVLAGMNGCAYLSSEAQQNIAVDQRDNEQLNRNLRPSLPYILLNLFSLIIEDEVVDIATLVDSNCVAERSRQFLLD